jgi:hypothetical protein
MRVCEQSLFLKMALREGIACGRLLHIATYSGPQCEGDCMKEYRFKATIHAAGGNGAYVLFPYDTQEEFSTRAKIPVMASFDGVPYTGSLVKYGHPQHMLPVLKNIREKIGKGPGDTVKVLLQRDDSVRTIEVPTEFATLMKKEGVLASFENLSYTNRKEYCRWITEAKREVTRRTRLSKAIAMLKKGVKTPFK